MLNRLRELLRAPAPAEDPACCEECLEALNDPERHHPHDLGEREEALLEAERRRWAGAEPRARS